MKFPISEVLLAFKNGNCVLKKTVMLLKDRNFVTTNMPSSAVHGTTWITSKDATITSLKSVESKIPEEDEVPVVSLFQLLLANVGRSVLINNEEKSYEIKEVLNKDLDNEKGLLVLVNEKKHERFVKVSDILTVISCDDKPLNKTITLKKKAKEIEIHYKPLTKDCTAQIYYLMKKITWCPSYFLNLNTETKMANLKMQSTIINDAENVFAKKFVCAAGAPKQKFENVMDPFVSGQTMQQFFSSLKAGSSLSTYASRNFQQQRLTSNVMMNMQATAPFSHSEVKEEEITGSNATDYYYYEFENVSVGKDQRIILPVFSMDLKYEEIYKCTLRKHDEKTPLKTTHCVKIVNNSDYIWTTGPVTITSEKQHFAGQDEICFTSKSVPSLVEIADALSIRVKFTEDVTMTKEYKNIYSSKYVKTIVKCKAEIKNYQSKEITILTDTKFTGEFMKSSDKHTSLSKEIYTGAESPVITKIEWESKVKANKTKEITFEYKKWVHSRNY